MISNDIQWSYADWSKSRINDNQDKHSTRSNLRSPAAVEWPLAVCARCPCCTSTGDRGNGCIWITGGNRPWSNPQGFSGYQKFLVPLSSNHQHFDKFVEIKATFQKIRCTVSTDTRLSEMRGHFSAGILWVAGSNRLTNMWSKSWLIYIDHIDDLYKLFNSKLPKSFFACSQELLQRFLTGHFASTISTRSSGTAASRTVSSGSWHSPEIRGLCLYHMATWQACDTLRTTVKEIIRRSSRQLLHHFCHFLATHPISIHIGGPEWSWDVLRYRLPILPARQLDTVPPLQTFAMQMQQELEMKPSRQWVSWTRPSMVTWPSFVSDESWG